MQKCSKLGHFGDQNDVIDQNLGRAQNIFSLKVSKNYLSKVYRHKFDKKKMSLMGKFGPNRSFLVKICENGSFLGQNVVISHNFGKVVKTFFQNLGKIAWGSPWMNLTKNVIKGVIFAKIFILGVFAIFF